MSGGGEKGKFTGNRPSLSAAYKRDARSSCLRLLLQLVLWPFAFAAESAGNNIAARIAMMAITTSNSSKVNASSKSRRLLAEYGTIDYYQAGGARALYL